MSKKRMRPTIEQSYSFLESFKVSLKKEKNELAKVLMQENLISLKIEALLNILAMLEFDALHIAKKVIDDRAFKKEIELEKGGFACGADLGHKTMGQLSEYVKNSNLKAFKEGRKLINLLPVYIKKRNQLTHNMLKQFTKVKEIEAVSRATYKQGEKILLSLDKLSKLIFQVTAPAGVAGLGSMLITKLEK